MATTSAPEDKRARTRIGRKKELNKAAKEAFPGLCVNFHLRLWKPILHLGMNIQESSLQFLLPHKFGVVALATGACPLELIESSHAIIVIKLQRKLSGNCVARHLPKPDNVCFGERG